MKTYVKKNKMLGSCAPQRQSAKHRKLLLSKKHHFPMARRHGIHAFQKSYNPNTKSFEPMEHHAVPENERIENA